MKKIRFLIAVALTVASLCGCDPVKDNIKSEIDISSEPPITENETNVISPVTSIEISTQSSESDPTQESPAKGKILIAYFTWAENVETISDVDATASASVTLPGNVGQMAAWIQDEIGGDLFSIQVKEPYSADYDECLERASEEKAQNARPALQNKVENFAEYDIIFIGYPNWWYTTPMAVFSFIDEYDFSGKRIVPFCSHGTGGLASSVKDITAALPDSTIESNVIGVSRDDISISHDTVISWLKEIGF